MTMPYSPSRSVYEGNNAATRFPFFFRVWDASQLVVTLTSPKGVTSEAAGWTADLDTAGGEIAYLHENAPLPDGWKLAITRNMPFTQEVNLVSASRFDPQVIEDALDQATAERQQTLEMMRRAVILPATSSETPQDVVQAVYAARDDAQNANSAAQAAKTAAGQSAVEAAASANTAAQVVLDATESAINAATLQAQAATASASVAAQSALDAAAVVPENLVQRVEAVEAKTGPATPTSRGIGRVATLADMEPDAVIANGPALIDVKCGVIKAVSTPHAIPKAGTAGRISPGFIPGIFVGDIRLLPFSPADLAECCPGWHFCNGDQYLLTSEVGKALNALPANFKAAWGIAVSGENISIPNMFYSDGRGYFLRAVNGTTRQVGNAELDAFQGHEHNAIVSTVCCAGGGSAVAFARDVSRTTNIVDKSGYGTVRYATETRSINIGQTPAIFLPNED